MQPRTSATKPTLASPATDSVYAAYAPARSPTVQEASPPRAPAAARMRSPSRGASDSAVRAWLAVASRSPLDQGEGGPVGLDAGGQRAEAGLVDDDEAGRRLLGPRTSPSPRTERSMADQPFRRASRSRTPARGHRRTPCASTGRTCSTSSGNARTQRASSGSRRSRCIVRHRQLHEIGGSREVAAGQRVPHGLAASPLTASHAAAR